jgi:hypothetical protein
MKQRIEPIILVAAVGFYVLAMTSQGLIPYLEKSLTRPETVVTVAGKVVARTSAAWSTSARAAGTATRSSCARSIATPTSGVP